MPPNPMSTNQTDHGTQDAATSAVIPTAAELQTLSGELEPLAALVFGWLDGGEEPCPEALASKLPADGSPVYCVVRSGGKALARGWEEGEAPAASMAALVKRLGAELAADVRGTVDAVEICLTHDWRPLTMTTPERMQVLDKMHRGVLGYELRHGDAMVRFAPSQTISTNRQPQKTIENFRNENRLTDTDFTRDAKVSAFGARQLLVRRPAEGSASPRVDVLYRGNVLIPQSDMNRAFVENLEKELGDFLFRSIQNDGRMVYIYYPSLGREDLKRNNMIRQWMASVALGRTARYRGADKKLFKQSEENIRYNLRKFYHASGKLGCIEYQNKVKLGAVALAVISILEHPNRKQFKRIEQRLWNMIDHLWQEDGSFVTFFKPAGRNDVQNFYPGEAQLAWSFLWRENRDPKLLEKFVASMRYYREWHQQNRNPAFVPWHVQAYYTAWKAGEDGSIEAGVRDELKDFVFDMSDWLLGMAQWEHNVRYPDELGRFYDPSHPNYGPPHGSATGVYLEGLIDAFELARELGETERQEKYRLAIIRGLRSVQQVMFKDERDMYYCTDPGFLRGGVRNTVYENIVRIDNIQHNQMAILKILAAFSDDDFLS